MQIGDLVRRCRMPDSAMALVIGFKEVYKGCGSNYPIIQWLDTHEVDSCSHTRLEVINESR
jgi:hypothetical protein